MNLNRLNPLGDQAIDQYSKAISTIDAPHKLIHEGMAYHASGLQTGLITTGTAEFIFRTAVLNFPHIHLLRMQFGDGDVLLEAFEGATVSAPGTAIPSFNLNRISSNTPLLTLYGGPTVTDDGTLIKTQWTPPTPTGQGNSVEGVVDVSQGVEWILNQSTDYLFRVTNNSGGTISFGYEIMWYEIDY